MAEITMKDNKQVIFDAYVASQKKLAMVQKSNPREEQQRAADVASYANAKNAIETGIFSEDLTTKYKDLMRVIELAEDELKTLYGITSTADGFAAMLDAKKAKEAELDEMLAEKKAHVDKEIKLCEQKIKDAKAEMDSVVREYEADLKKKRKREEEEYQYSLNRIRQKENDEWEDEKSEREANISLIEENTEKANMEAHAKLAEIDLMKKQITDLEAAVVKAKEDGLKEGKDKAGKEYSFEKRHMELTQKYEIESRDKEIAALTAQNTKLEATIVELQTKLDASYKQMKELAADTVKSSGGVKILNGENSK